LSAARDAACAPPRREAAAALGIKYPVLRMQCGSSILIAFWPLTQAVRTIAIWSSRHAVKIGPPLGRLTVAKPLDFLLDWVRDHMNPTVYDDKAGAEYLAEECLRDAKNAGIEEASLIEAARGDLTKYMLSKLNFAVKKRGFG